MTRSEQIELQPALAPQQTSRWRALPWSRLRWKVVLEWLIILLAAYLYGATNLLNFDPMYLQQTGEHNESATLPLLAEIGITRYGEIPLWNPYMNYGYPHSGDFINHFWHPVSTLPVLIWGGINGMKVSIFLAFLLGGLGQWLFTHVMGGRGLVRLWTGLIFMTSGGLALLWHTGWYELLLGAVWFPWCYASIWWSLPRRDKTSLMLAALCVAMVLTTGGGYYPVYLYLSSAVFAGVMLLFAPGGQRWRYLRRAIAIGTLGVLLVMVMLLPWVDTLRYTAREAGLDLEQTGSLRIFYALFSYVIAEYSWNDNGSLGAVLGFNYFYIGALPLAALTLVPLAMRDRARRPALIAAGVLFAFLIAWHSNRHTPMQHLYDQVPFFYTFRFPARLLIIAACPLLVLAALGLQHLASGARDWARNLSLGLTSVSGERTRSLIPLGWLVNAALALALYISAHDVHKTNKGFAFHEQYRDPRTSQTLQWLKQYDPSLYYTNIGGGAIWWWWTPDSYMLEMPVSNFIYNRYLESYFSQIAPESPFYARPKYQISGYDQELPPDAQLLNDFGDFGLWYLPDALPFAFSAASSLVDTQAPLAPANVAAMSVRLDGPNRVVVSGTMQPESQLIVLVSDYPGWRVEIDGQPAPVVPVNGYLGAKAPPGAHTYVFSFRPSKHYIGLLISLLTLLLMAVLVLSERALIRRWLRYLRAWSSLRAWRAGKQPAELAPEPLPETPEVTEDQQEPPSNSPHGNQLDPAV